jgi:hypothetical protein
VEVVSVSSSIRHEIAVISVLGIAQRKAADAQRALDDHYLGKLAITLN